MLVVVAAVFLNTSGRKLILLERQALHAKRSFPYLSWTVANWAGSAGLLTLSSFLGQHGGMIGSRISWGYLKSPISQESFLHTVLPKQTSPLALDANGATIPLLLYHACAKQSLLPISIPCDAAFTSTSNSKFVHKCVCLFWRRFITNTQALKLVLLSICLKYSDFFFSWEYVQNVLSWFN